MFTPDAPLTYVDRMIAYVAPMWALRRARDRRTLYLEAQRDLAYTRWVDGAPYTQGAAGDWYRVAPAVRPPGVTGPTWRPSSWWERPGAPAPSRWTQAVPPPDPTPTPFRRVT